jgi:hypothetical protein
MLFNDAVSSAQVNIISEDTERWCRKLSSLLSLELFKIFFGRTYLVTYLITTLPRAPSSPVLGPSVYMSSLFYQQ